MTADRFDPAKDATNRRTHKLSLAFGDRIFEDGHHLLIASIREIDGEERFQVVGQVEGNCSPTCSSGGRTSRVSSR